MDTLQEKTNDSKKYVRIVLISLLLIALMSLFLLIAEDVLEQQWIQIDGWFQNFVLSFRKTWITAIFIVITNLANPIILGVIAFVMLITCKSLRRYTLAQFLNMALVSLLNLLLKTFFVRPRPDYAIRLVTETGYSFPSGHTMVAVAFYGFLIFMAWQVNWKNCYKILATVLGSLVVFLVGFSRIYLGVHYASDVLGAFCISLFYTIIFILIVKRTNVSIVNETQEYKKHSFLSGFKFAFRGIVTAFQEENNLLVQFAATMLVVVFGAFLRISAIEWSLCLIMCFLVMALEFVNTAIENICDRITAQNDGKIKKIKDISAGAVLLLAICSVIVGLIIFLPKITMFFI